VKILKGEGVIRSRESKTDRQHNRQKCEDTKGVISGRKSKKDKQHNGREKRHKRTSNGLQNTAKKTKE
jgi:hypothetical protein